jgi:hypothetical protein
MELLVPQVGVEQAKSYSNVWKYNGLALPLEPHHIQFATDFANITLKSFVLECQEKAQKAIEQMELENKLKGE